MNRFKTRFSNAWHNIVLHPLAGLCWLLGFKTWGDRLHGEDKPHWWMVEFEWDGPRIVEAAELATRPADARPAGDDPFTPWEETRDHLHFASPGRPSGAHVYATREEVYEKVTALLIDFLIAR